MASVADTLELIPSAWGAIENYFSINIAENASQNPTL
jgi:hypothetical protein